MIIWYVHIYIHICICIYIYISSVTTWFYNPFQQYRGKRKPSPRNHVGSPNEDLFCPKSISEDSKRYYKECLLQSIIFLSINCLQQYVVLLDTGTVLGPNDHPWSISLGQILSILGAKIRCKHLTGWRRLCHFLSHLRGHQGGTGNFLCHQSNNHEWVSRVGGFH